MSQKVMPADRQAVEAGTSHAGAEGGGMSEEPIFEAVSEWLCSQSDVCFRSSI
jgi:hypothetical protein